MFVRFTPRFEVLKNKQKNRSKKVLRKDFPRKFHRIFLEMFVFKFFPQNWHEGLRKELVLRTVDLSDSRVENWNRFERKRIGFKSLNSISFQTRDVQTCLLQLLLMRGIERLKREKHGRGRERMKENEWEKRGRGDREEEEKERKKLEFNSIKLNIFYTNSSLFVLLLFFALLSFLSFSPLVFRSRKNTKYFSMDHIFLRTS